MENKFEECLVNCMPLSWERVRIGNTILLRVQEEDDD
jgi:hypothetical protein